MSTEEPNIAQTNEQILNDIQALHQIEKQLFENLESKKKELIFKYNLKTSDKNTYEELINILLKNNDIDIKVIDIKKFLSLEYNYDEFKKLLNEKEFKLKFNLERQDNMNIKIKINNNNGNYTLTDFLRLKDDNLYMIKLLYEYENFKKLLNLNELKKFKHKKYNDSIIEKALIVYDLLYKIPKYKKIFEHKYIEDIEEEEEEVYGGNNDEEIYTSYDTTMYKYIIKSLISYLIDLLDSNKIKQPIALKFFKDLEEAKEKLITNSSINIKLKEASYEYIIYTFKPKNNIDLKTNNFYAYNKFVFVNIFSNKELIDFNISHNIFTGFKKFEGNNFNTIDFLIIDKFFIFL
jgi:hypothetical protein